MKSILIATQVDDEHALAVDYVLSKRGHDVVRWFGADFPHKQTISIEFGPSSGPAISVAGNELDFDPSSIDTVWYRRPCLPRLDEALIHPEDIAAAKLENEEFYRSFVQLIGPEAAWVNPMAAARSAECKLVQLREAIESGLTVPKTLSTNDPERIRRFIKENEPHQTIYKPFFPARWFGEDKYAIAATALVKSESLPSDRAMRLTAGIFQQRLEKAYEVRATFFGDYAVAARINSQENPRGLLDWRSIPFWDNRIEPMSLPENVLARCRVLMRKLGILFGCFDFIVTPDGEYVFLEVNQQGQFLWKEHLCPSLKMLETFCQFIANPGRDFCYSTVANPASVKEIVLEPLYQELHARDRDAHTESHTAARGKNRHADVVQPAKH